MTDLPPPGRPTPPTHPGSGPPIPPPAYSPTPPPAYQLGGYRRLGTLSRAMLILLAIAAGFQVILIPVLFSVKGKASDFLDGKISSDTFENALNTQQVVQSLQGGVLIAIIVLTMVWMYRLAQNHRAFGRPGSTWSPGWAIGGWFVPPGVVYAVPWLMFNELWKGSDPENVPNDPNWKRRPLTPLTTIWWILYGFVPIIGLAVGFGIGFGSFSDNSARKLADRLNDFYVVEMVLGIVSIITAGVYAKLVHELTRRQQALTNER